MNQCHFLGNLTRDPDLRSLESGKQVVNFGMAVNRRRGKDKNEVAYLDLEAWDTTAELIAKHFAKGDPIIVHGSVKMEQWTDKQTGQNRSKLKFRVNEFEFVPGGKKNGNGEEPAKAPAKSAAPAKGKSAPPADNQEPEFTPAESDDGNIPF